MIAHSVCVEAKKRSFGEDGAWRETGERETKKKFWTLEFRHAKTSRHPRPKVV